MGTFNKFIERLTVQTAVYWGNPVADGYGGYAFDDPVEIFCRWDINRIVVKAPDGSEITSEAQVIVRQDVEVHGRLFLGTLDDLDSSEETDPNNISTIHEINCFVKISMPKSLTDFFRQAIL